MSGRLVLEQPAWLLLIPVCMAWAWWLARSARPRLEPWRSRWAARLRGLTLLFLILALAGLTATRREDRLTVVFAVDGSDSVGGPGSETARELLAVSAEEKGEGDQAGVVVFGGEAMIESFPSESFHGGEVLARPDPEASDPSSALRLARGLFPPGHEKRLVLVTDGLETRGSIEQAAAAAPADLDLVWVELESADVPEALIERISVPERLVAGQPHRVRVLVRSSRPTPATLRLYRGSVPVAAVAVELEPGPSQVFAFDQLAPEGSGAILYRARLEVDDDGSPDNNRAEALVAVEGKPSVLIVDGEPSTVTPLERALESSGMSVTRGGPGALPADLRHFAAYDAVILSDVAATHFSSLQLESLATWVRDLGGGLLMLGGPESFGAGGYWRTPVEDVLPMAMEVKDRSYLPSVGLVLCVDKSGSMAGYAGVSKIEVAKTAAAEVARLLEPMDRMGVLAFDAAAKWVVPLTSGGDRELILQGLASLRAGGGTDAYPAMQRAAEALSNSDVRVKHVLLLTDGQLQSRDHEGLAADMAAEGITISTVAVGTDADVYTLERIAQAGQGSFYSVDDVERIPRIFLREAFRVARSWVVEEPFRALRRAGHPAISGFDPSSAPPLQGYVAASEKPGAEHLLVTPRGDPLLSVWRVGLGKAVAFTSDAKARWAGSWLGWPGYEPFWSTLVRFAIRDPSAGRLRASTSMADGRLRLVADALDERGAYVNGASLRARVVDPEGRAHELELRQEGPGRYAAEIDAEVPGPYLAAVVQEAAGTGQRPHGAVATAVRPYADEFRGLSRAAVGLERLVASGRVRKVSDPAAVFEHLGTGGEIRWPLAPWLLALAAVLLVSEVAVRRAAWPEAWRRKARAVEVSSDTRLSSLQKARERVKRPVREVAEVSGKAPASPAVVPAPAPEESTLPERARPSGRPEPAAAGGYTSRLLEAKRRSRSAGR